MRQSALLVRVLPRPGIRSATRPADSRRARGRAGIDAETSAATTATRRPRPSPPTARGPVPAPAAAPARGRVRAASKSHPRGSPRTAAGANPPNRQAWNVESRSASSSSERRSSLRQALEGLDEDAAALVAPERPTTRPSTMKVATDCGVFVEKTRGRCSSGRIPVRRWWTRSVASHVGRNRGGAGVSPSGIGARGRSISSWPDSSRKRRSVVASIVGAIVAGGTPAQPASVLHRRRAEPAQVTGARAARDLLPRSPPRRRPTARGARTNRRAAAPRARGRNTDELELEGGAVPGRRVDPKLGDELVATPRPVREELRHLARGRVHLPRRRLAAVRLQPPLEAHVAQAGQEERGSRASRRCGSSRASALPGRPSAARARA